MLSANFNDFYLMLMTPSQGLKVGFSHASDKKYWLQKNS